MGLTNARCPIVERSGQHGSGYSISKAIRSSRRARRGAGCWLRTTMAPPAGADNRAARLRGGRRRRPVVLSQGAHARMDVAVGEGFARPHSGRSRDVRPRPPVCARGRGRRHAPGRRARVSSGAGVGSGQWRRRLITGAAAQRPAARSSHCSDSSNPTVSDISTGRSRSTAFVEAQRSRPATAALPAEA